MKDFVEIDVSNRRKKKKTEKNSSKIALTKNTVSTGGKFVCPNRVRDIEKYAFTIRKHGFLFQKYLKKLKKIGVHLQEYGSSLKFDFPQISVIFFIGRKKLGIK